MTNDPVEQYTREAKKFRRRRFRRAAGVLGVAAIGSGAMILQMTDIGHATGFAGLTFGLLFGAVTMLYYGVRG